MGALVVAVPWVDISTKGDWKGRVRERKVVPFKGPGQQLQPPNGNERTRYSWHLERLDRDGLTGVTTLLS